MPTIKIPSGCKPSKACSKDRARPILNHASLRRREDGLWLLATDAYLAVALKVEGDAEDGWVPIDVLKLLERNAKGRMTIEQVSATSWKVTHPDKAVVVYDQPDLAGSVAFPNFDKIGIFDAPKGTTTEPFGFNAELLGRVGEAIGSGLRTRVEGPLKPIRLESIGYGGERLALLMPIRLLEDQNARLAKAA